MGASVPRLGRRKRRLRAVSSCTECHRRKQKCDRETPCANCIARGNQSRCRYEQFSQDIYGQRGYEQIIQLNPSPASVPDVPSAAQPPAKPPAKRCRIQVLGFVGENPDTSIGILNSALERDKLCLPDNLSSPPEEEPATSGSAWYRSYIRELPPSHITERLIADFFDNLNWQYNPLDAVTFHEDKARWEAIPYREIWKGISNLPRNALFFPALLFQVVALSLLYSPPNDRTLDSIKYKADMTLDELAEEYSAAGTGLIEKLAPTGLSCSAVQAMFLRTLFLKTTGKVVESWDFLGQTIVGARRLEWHLDRPCGRSSSSLDPVHILWDRETSRKTWLNLCCWDAHMSTMLGRPLRIRLADMDTIPPLDAPLISDRLKARPRARAELEPPTALTVQIVNHSLARFLIRIYEMGPTARHSEVQELREEILAFREHLAPFLWTENPDRTFDGQAECYWLTDARETIESVIQFTLLALHRPHIFKSAKSRKQALDAGLKTLRADTRENTRLPLMNHRSFAYLFSTFDAAVAVATIHCLYPGESPRSFDTAMQRLEAVIANFERARPLNTLAGPAVNVLVALHSRLSKATKRRYSSSTSGQSATFSVETASTVSLSPPIAEASQVVPWSMGNVADVCPPAPLHDLLYRDLCGTVLNNCYVDCAGSTPLDPSLDWMFQGQFEGDEFWNFMNATNGMYSESF